jgi:hypothetical protein
MFNRQDTLAKTDPDLWAAIQPKTSARKITSN